MIVFSLAGCNLFNNRPNFALDRVTVYIKAEYEQEFKEQTFTMDDFAWSNVERIAYIVWHDNVVEPYEYITIYLIEPGKNQVLDAIEHFKTLDFVKYAEKSVILYWD